MDFGIPRHDPVRYPNVSAAVGVVAASGRATIHEMSTVYGLEDIYDMIEIIVIDAHNRRAEALAAQQEK